MKVTLFFLFPCFFVFFRGCFLSPGVEQGAHEVEEFRRVGIDDHGDHFAVEVGGDIIRGDQVFELLQPVLGVEELAAFGQVGPQVLVGQPQFLEQDAGPIRLETATVEPDVEQPVVFVVGFWGGRVEQELAVGFVAFQTNFCFERPDFIQPQYGDALQHQERQVFWNSLLGVVPEDNPLPFGVEESFQRGLDLVRSLIYFFVERQVSHEYLKSHLTKMLISC